MSGVFGGWAKSRRLAAERRRKADWKEAGRLADADMDMRLATMQGQLDAAIVMDPRSYETAVLKIRVRAMEQSQAVSRARRNFE